MQRYETSKNTKFIISESQSNDTLMLFDLSIRGHHPNYIYYLIRYWISFNISGKLKIVISPKFINEHKDVIEFASSRSNNIIEFISISQNEEDRLAIRKNAINRQKRYFQEWQLYCKYAACLKPFHCLLMYFDTLKLPLMLGLKSPCNFSAIYFKPTFHYHKFGSRNENKKLIKRTSYWLEKRSLIKILKHPQLCNLFCLDRFAVQDLNQSFANSKLCFLPDPVDYCKNDTSEDIDLIGLKDRLKIQNHRKIFLLFGSLTARKGIFQLLEAIDILPDYISRNICILIVGESQIEAKIQDEISLLETTNQVQLIRVNEFVSESQVKQYFQAADYVIAPYQRHIGMSGILLLAAAAQKIVIGPNYGLMGKIIQEYELGLSVNTEAPCEIAKAICKVMVSSEEQVCNYENMKLLVEQNSSDNFARLLIEKSMREINNNI